MPFLPDAVASILAQRGVALELIAVDDGSTDGSGEWLRSCAAALEEQTTRCGSSAYDDVVANAALLPWAVGGEPLSAVKAASRASPGTRLRVLSVSAPAGLSGQGLALNEAFLASRGAFVGEMESDDVRPPHAFALLRQALDAHPEWHAASSCVALGGWPREGMQRWIDWQNGVGCGGAAELAANRFVEIPAQRASCLFRRTALESLGRRPYRDLWHTTEGLVDAAAGNNPPVVDASLPGWWPVDTDFFGRWFDKGLVCGKVNEPLFVWRQYPTQSTRTHSRCDQARQQRGGVRGCPPHTIKILVFPTKIFTSALQARLRAAKAHFLAAPGGPACLARDSGRFVQLWGCGKTLGLWAAALEAEGVAVLPIDWRPGEAPPRAACAPSPCCVARLFAFGMERARAKVRATAPGGFNEPHDVWVA